MNSYPELSVVEKAVMSYFLAAVCGKTVAKDAVVSGLRVNSWTHTGIGFLSEFEKSESTKVGTGDESYTWQDIGGRLNGKIEAGFLIFVDGGHIVAVEGFVYGENEWPTTVDEITLYPYKGTSYT